MRTSDRTGERGDDSRWTWGCSRRAGAAGTEPDARDATPQRTLSWTGTCTAPCTRKGATRATLTSWRPRAGAPPFRYYVYVTGEDAASGAAFPVYGSPDLIRWTALGYGLAGAPGKAHWAPCVRHVPGLARPYVMLYSRAVGVGEAAHIGHALRRADAVAPEGPFQDSGEVLTPDLDFAIDPDVYRLPDGRLMLAFATDFVADAPLGTGIVEAPIGDDLRALTGPWSILARATQDWQVYDPARRLPWMTIPGVDWERDTVRWHTVEAPSGGLVSPVRAPRLPLQRGLLLRLLRRGRHRARRAGGAAAPHRRRRGLRPPPPAGGGGLRPGPLLLAQRGPDGRAPYLMYHARFGSPRAPRQFALARLRWDGEGRPVAEPP